MVLVNMCLIRYGHQEFNIFNTDYHVMHACFWISIICVLWILPHIYISGVPWALCLLPSSFRILYWIYWIGHYLLSLFFHVYLFVTSSNDAWWDAYLLLCSISTHVDCSLDVYLGYLSSFAIQYLCYIQKFCVNMLHVS